MPWSPVISTGEVVAIHAALLPTDDGSGEIVFFGGDDHDVKFHRQHLTDHTARFDCRRADAVERVTIPVFASFDVFCCGHAFTGDGRLLIAGGTEAVPDDTPHFHAQHHHWSGERRAVVYRAGRRAFTEVASMGPKPGTTFGGGRWYPSLCTIATGEVLAVGGHPRADDDRHTNNRPERYQPIVNRWTMLPPIGSDDPQDPDLFPRLHTLRDGVVFVPSHLNGGNERCVSIDPLGGVVREVCNLPDGAYHGYDCPSVLLPLTPRDGYRPRVLLCGGVVSQVADLGHDAPVWTTVPRSGSTATRPRVHASATILPTGDVLMTGGDGVMEPELYATPLDHAFGTPSYTGGVGTWTTVREPATVLRNYHSTALLMPDGRVWTAGGNFETGDVGTSQPFVDPTPEQEKIEIFEPPYPTGDRPTITACPGAVAYGEEFEVETPQARRIRSVTLLRCGSSTHAFNPDQRCVFLDFRAASLGRLLVSAPPHAGVAPPGTYLLFVVDGVGRPCQRATFLRIGGRTTLVSDPWDHVVLDDSSGAGPALASHGGRLFLAWKGSGNSQLNLMFSVDGGATFKGKRVLDETSDHGPALVPHAGRLTLAWVGEDDHLNVARVALFASTAGAFGIEGLESKVVLDDETDDQPALASHDGRLFLAWKGSGNSQLNLMFSDDGGATFRGKRVLDETSDHGPALVSHGGRLLLTWAGENNEHLNVAPVRFFANTAGGFGIDGLDPKAVLADSSEEAPSLASHGGRLFLAWKGANNPQLNLMTSSDGGATFHDKRVLIETTHHAPALASHGGHLRLAWAGEGDELLNVAAASADTLDFVSEVRWAGRLDASDGVAEGNPFPPENVLGEPDGLEFQCFPGMSATYADFRGRHYPHLVELLGKEMVTFGDALTRDQLARADVVAFERNGTAPAPGGGWESCDWTFTTSAATVSVSWRSGADAPRDPHVLANGSVAGGDYKRYFEVTHGSPMRDDEVISFLVLTLPELDTADPKLTIEVRGVEIPDIDVIGLVPR